MQQLDANNSWQLRLLEDVVDIHDQGRTPIKATERIAGTTPYCGANGVIDYVAGFTHQGKFAMLAEDGGYFGPGERSSYIMTGQFWANNHVHILKGKDGVLDTVFLHHYLNHCDLSSYLTGATRPKLTQAAMKRVSISLPYPDNPGRSLAEQRRIVARIEALLAEVGEMRKLQGEIGGNANELMNSLLNETFAMTEMAIWPNRDRLDNLAEITARQVDPTLPEHRNRPHIYGKSIEEGTGRLLQYNTVAEDNMTSSKYHFQPGAVLYSKIRPYLRKVTIVDFEGLCSADMYPLHVKTDKLLPEFLMWSLLSPTFTNYANNLSGRARIPKLNRMQLFDYEMAYPDIKAQKMICERMQNAREGVDELKRISENDSLNLNQLEQAILAQAFQGDL